MAGNRSDGAKLYLPAVNQSIQDRLETRVGNERRLTTPKWYAAQTKSRHEKSVAEHLRQRQIEHFLPLYETVHQWNNGRHRVHLPLFPGYVFVHIALQEKLRVLQVPGLAQIISFTGAPAPLPDGEIETLQNAMAAGVFAQPYRYLNLGSRVEICRGPLQGLRGILLRHQGQFRVVLSIEMIMRSVVVEVDATDVVALDHNLPSSSRIVPESHVSVAFV